MSCSNYETYGRYDTLVKAKLACSSDANCFAVYNDVCDHNGVFSLCPVAIKTITSDSSCLYVKQEFSGRYCCIFPIISALFFSETMPRH